jgi:hypothetical protein
MLPAHLMGDFPLEQCKFIEYNGYINDAMAAIGVELSAPKKWMDQLAAVGFTNIHCHTYNWPVGPWAKGKKNKVLGKLAHQNFYRGIDTVAPLLSKVLQWDAERIRRFHDEVRAEFNEGKAHVYVAVGYWYAQKPVGSLSSGVDVTTS